VAKEINRLTTKAVQNLSKPGRYGDGEGLYLVIDDKGVKAWVLRFQINGRRRDMGLGRFPGREVKEARLAAKAARKLIGEGVDPIEDRKAPTGVPTFLAASEAIIADLSPGWRGAKTKEGWERSLYRHAGSLAKKPVDQITTDDVLRVVRPLWTAKPESGAKLRERLERLLDAARAKGWRTGENPARWRGHLAHMLPKRQKLSRGHFKAMPYADAPTFMAKIRKQASMGARALEWTILTASREGMTRGATWREIRGEVWTIPAARMKDGRDHRVPLSAAALALVERMALGGRPASGFIFPGSRDGSALSNATQDAVLKRMGLDYTVHGFRSTFRDWAGDETDHAREVVEAALAHAVGDAVERAYRRGDALEKRRRLMADWATFLATPPTDAR
jgi:integrase